MEIRRGRLYFVDFNPRIRTKPGKLRPALVVQSDLVNEAGYPSTIVVPATTRLVDNPGILRLRIRKGQGGLKRESDLLLGQLIVVANESFWREVGVHARASDAGAGGAGACHPGAVITCPSAFGEWHPAAAVSLATAGDLLQWHPTCTC